MSSRPPVVSARRISATRDASGKVPRANSRERRVAGCSTAALRGRRHHADQTSRRTCGQATGSSAVRPSDDEGVGHRHAVPLTLGVRRATPDHPCDRAVAGLAEHLDPLDPAGAGGVDQALREDGADAPPLVAVRHDQRDSATRDGPSLTQTPWATSSSPSQASTAPPRRPSGSRASTTAGDGPGPRAVWKRAYADSGESPDSRPLERSPVAGGARPVGDDAHDARPVQEVDGRGDHARVTQDPAVPEATRLQQRRARAVRRRHQVGLPAVDDPVAGVVHHEDVPAGRRVCGEPLPDAGVAVEPASLDGPPQRPVRRSGPAPSRRQNVSTREPKSPIPLMATSRSAARPCRAA